jgi:hypothetical protein
MGSQARVAAVCALALSLAPGEAAADPSPLDPNVVSAYGETETPRSAAMGGALRALGTGVAGIYMNPAALASVPGYDINISTQLAIPTRRWVLGAAIADSVTAKLAGAFSIQGTPIAMDPDGIDRSTLDVRIGLAYPITDRFIIGLNGRYLNAKQSGTAAPSYGFCNSLASGGLIDSTSGSYPRSNTLCPNTVPGQPTAEDRFAVVNIPTIDAGLLIKPTDSLAIAFVGQNLTYANNGFLPMIVAGGLGYTNGLFAIEVDGLADFSSWGVPGAEKPTARIMTGAEYKIGGAVPVRLGYRFDQGATKYSTTSQGGGSVGSTLSFGTGYIGGPFAVEVSGNRTLSNPGATTIFFAASYLVDSSGSTKASSGGATQVPE